MAICLVTAQKTDPPGDRNRLLILDDEPSITKVIEISARQLGFASVAIHDPGEFGRAVEAFKPTLIFLDIAMPKRDGVELIGDLSAWNYLGRVVIMSGYPLFLKMACALAETRGLRLANPLAKPFSKQQILDLLLDLAERSTD